MIVLKNISYNLGINATNLLFPIILIPFYTSVLGIEKYGLLAITFAICNYFSIISEFGWSTLGPIKIAKIRDSIPKSSTYISSVITGKLCLLFISMLILLLFSFIYPLFVGYQVVYYSIATVIFARAFNVYWIILGLEQLVTYFYINLILKILTLTFIYIFITTPEDFVIVNFFIGGGEILIAFIGLIYIYKTYKYHFIKPSLPGIYKELKSGFPMFLTNISITSLLNSNMVFLGFFTKNETLLGVFSISEKIISLSKHVLGTLNQIIIPRASNISLSGIKALNYFLRKVFISYAFLTVLGCLFLYLFSSFLVDIFTNNEIEYTSRLVGYMVLIPLFFGLAQPSFMSLVINDRKKVYTSIYIVGFFAHIFVFILLFKPLDILAPIVASTFSEFLIFFLISYSVMKKKQHNYLKI